MSPDRATSGQPDEWRSPAELTPKAGCESGRGRAGCSIRSGGISSSLGVVRELPSGRELRKGSTLDGTAGSRPRPLTPRSRARSSEGPAPHVPRRKAGGPSGCVAGRWLL